MILSLLSIMYVHHRFLPQMTRGALHQALAAAGINPPGKDQVQQHMQPIKCKSTCCVYWNAYNCADIVVR